MCVGVSVRIEGGGGGAQQHVEPRGGGAAGRGPAMHAASDQRRLARSATSVQRHAAPGRPGTRGGALHARLRDPEASHASPPRVQRTTAAPPRTLSAPSSHAHLSWRRAWRLGTGHFARSRCTHEPRTRGPGASHGFARSPPEAPRDLELCTLSSEALHALRLCTSSPDSLHAHPPSCKLPVLDLLTLSARGFALPASCASSNSTWELCTRSTTALHAHGELCKLTLCSASHARLCSITRSSPAPHGLAALHAQLRACKPTPHLRASRPAALHAHRQPCTLSPGALHAACRPCRPLQPFTRALHARCPLSPQPRPFARSLHAPRTPPRTHLPPPVHNPCTP